MKILALYVCSFLFSLTATSEVPKRKNRQADRAEKQRVEREKMLRDISLKQKNSFTLNNPGDQMQPEDNIQINEKFPQATFDADSSEIYDVTQQTQGFPGCIDLIDPLSMALYHYWRNELAASYICVKLAISLQADRKYVLLAQALAYSLENSRWFVPSQLPLEKASLPDSLSPLSIWEILGPFQSGKLEMDADPTFLYSSLSDRRDICTYILKMLKNTTIPSELVTSGITTWSKFTSKASMGLIEVSFSVPWGDLAQSLGGREFLEFQAWARTVTYVRRHGVHLLDCHGTAQTVFNCQITEPVPPPASTPVAPGKRAVVDTEAFRAFPASNIPDLLVGAVDAFFVPASATQAQTQTAKAAAGQSTSDWGLLFSPYFSIPVLNLLPTTTKIQVKVETPRHIPYKLFVRIPTTPTSKLSTNGTNSQYSPSPQLEVVDSVELEPGQILPIPLELYTDDDRNILQFPCRQGFTIPIVLSTPRSSAVSRVGVEFGCRHRGQSFLYSFLDHDYTVSVAAAIFPVVSAANPRSSNQPESCEEGEPLATCHAYRPRARHNSFPVLLTLHGTGVEARNQADAYKVKTPSMKSPRPVISTINQPPSDFVFGVEGFWVIAPTRHGAHNWEGIGHRTAIESKYALAKLLTRLPNLPQVRLRHGILTGHSMGGHGALVAGGFTAGDAVCLAAISSWIRKEDYGDGNAFFRQDAGGAYADPELKRVLSNAMGEGHVDHLVDNFKGLEILLRVGRDDRNTHPWYSRRMYRLLQAAGVSSTYDEVPNQGHWWWDTLTENDGGVVNDAKMRSFYKRCLELSLTRTEEESQRSQLLSDHIDNNQTEKLNNNTISMVSDGLYLNRESKVFKVAESRCSNNFTLQVIYPPAHTPSCGLQIRQQTRPNIRSSVNVRCSNDSAAKLCRLRTHNVRRLRVWLDEGVSYGLSKRSIDIDGMSLSDLSIGKQHDSNVTNTRDLNNSSYIDVCWRDRPTSRIRVDDSEEFVSYEDSTGVDTIALPRSRNIEICRCKENLVMEKTLEVFGPIRQAQAARLVIVYGTPQDPALRAMLRDFAMYLANSFYASHQSMIQVVSDLQFKLEEYIVNTENTVEDGDERESFNIPNIIFIGDPSVNKVMRKLYVKYQSVFVNDENDAKIPGDIIMSDIKGSDWNVDFVGYFPDVRFETNKELHRHSKYTSFCISRHCHSSEDIAYIFTFPLGILSRVQYTVDKNIEPDVLAASLGVCIGASSIEGFLHMSRVAWPTVPPMVRAPFANYIPDYMVIDGTVWNKGFGGVKLAGFWSSEWLYSSKDSYVHPPTAG